jgi:tRNA threonylcarbamoyladenosine biosynthesis protein TsaE
MIRAHSKSVDDTRALAGELAMFAKPGDVILLSGDLGAGKTAFAQGFGRALGIDEPITSPTFTLMRQYDEARVPLLHVDVYRLDRMQEVVELGLPEMLDAGMVALVEWGDVVAPVLPADFLHVDLDFGDGDDERAVRLRSVGVSWSARMKAIGRALERWTV